MIQHLPRPRHLILIACAATLAAALWYATRTVEPGCTFGTVQLGDPEGNPLPDAQGRVRTSEDLIAEGYRHAIASGQCEAPHARWHDWLR